MSRLSMKDNNLRCVTLFSGCGGLDFGLSKAGFEIILANDIEPICAESHKANFPKVPFFLGSVSDLTLEKMAQISNGETNNPIALVAGGPPCPPFSKSRFYRKEKPRALDDPLGWETLTGFFKVVALLKPSALLLENVAGIAYKVHSDALDFVLTSAKNLGYQCSFGVFNTADYGVPQIRERFLLVGMKDSAFRFPEASHAEKPQQNSLFEKRLMPWVPAGDVLNDLDTQENADDTGHFAGGRHNNLLKLVPPGENYLHFTKERGHPDPQFKWRSRYWSFLLKLSPTLPSWTIQARRSNNMGPFHWKSRILRIPEIKRLQTFPDKWVLKGSVEQQWRQVGNAVPPQFAQVVAKSLKAQLLALRKNNKACK